MLRVDVFNVCLHNKFPRCFISFIHQNKDIHSLQTKYFTFVSKNKTVIVLQSIRQAVSLSGILPIVFCYCHLKGGANVLKECYEMWMGWGGGGYRALSPSLGTITAKGGADYYNENHAVSWISLMTMGKSKLMTFKKREISEDRARQRRGGVEWK